MRGMLEMRVAGIRRENILRSQRTQTIFQPVLWRSQKF
jgi:hypothetical protein